MKQKDLVKLLEERQTTLIDPDGYDLAFYDAALGLLKHCGDGGLSSRWFDGIQYVLENLDEEEIEGNLEEIESTFEGVL